MWVTNSAADRSGGQAVVLGHVADPGPDRRGVGGRVEAEHPRPDRWSAASRPSRILIKVDLPAPFAPTRPMIPGSTATVRSDSAVTRPPYVLVSDWVAISVTAPA